uniref:Uncharacterized protein n=1 Tax=Anguilla anguilla TaxID=7936 RepID=A0A0E9QBP1_ANGAN
MSSTMVNWLNNTTRSPYGVSTQGTVTVLGV